MGMFISIVIDCKLIQGHVVRFPLTMSQTIVYLVEDEIGSNVPE